MELFNYTFHGDILLGLYVWAVCLGCMFGLYAVLINVAVSACSVNILVLRTSFVNHQLVQCIRIPRLAISVRLCIAAINGQALHEAVLLLVIRTAGCLLDFP